MDSRLTDRLDQKRNTAHPIRNKLLESKI